MKHLVLLFGIGLLVSGCMSTVPALSVDNSMLQNYKVKGRQGLLINQKLGFGEYQTSRVRRSWTRGSGSGFGVPVDRNSRKFLSFDQVHKDQRLSFDMKDELGNYAEVYAASSFSSRDINYERQGRRSSDLLGITLESENIFYVQLFMNDEIYPWELVLDNQAAQQFADSYQGVFAFSDREYYHLKPITRVAGRKGPVNLLFGSIGYEIFNPDQELVAAVSVVDNGSVYFNTTDPKEKFLLANLCAALLLQQDISE